MDANKLVILQELPYSIQKCCGICRHGNFPKDDWGTCEATDYKHLKHRDGFRKLSIYKFGTCPKFEQTDLYYMGGYEQFLSRS